MAELRRFPQHREIFDSPAHPSKSDAGSVPSFVPASPQDGERRPVQRAIQTSLEHLLVSEQMFFSRRRRSGEEVAACDGVAMEDMMCGLSPEKKFSGLVVSTSLFYHSEMN